MMPRLLMMMSFSTGGRPRSSNFGISVVIVRSTIPTRACCTNALTRKRPMPGGAIAKLHSFVDSNSAACLSFITLRTSSIVCCGDSIVFDTGAILPSTLIAGGKPDVTKRSEPFSLTSSSSSSWMKRVARSLSIAMLPVGGRLSGRAEQFLVDRARPRLGRGDRVATDEVDEALVERLHAERLSCLDRRIHLRDLVLADQVTDRRRADHDLVRRDAALPVLRLDQRLRDDRDERLRQHRAHHVLLGRGEHVDDPVDGLCRRARVQRAEHEVARLGRRHREADGLEVAHLADEDVIRVLAEGGAQCIRERKRVRAELALVDQTL